MRHVGRITARALAERFGDLESLLAASEEDLAMVDAVGPVIAASVSRFSRSAAGDHLIRALREAGVRPEPLAPGPGGDAPLRGKRIVLTGTLESLTREEARVRIEEAGGRVVSSVSKKTDMVVAGDSPGSKKKKAEDMGVEVVDEARFLALLGEEE